MNDEKKISSPDTTEQENTLTLRNLKVIFPNEAGVIRAVEGIDLDIKPGECVALVGESGCGKSMTSLAIMKLLSSPPAMIRVDELKLNGEDLTLLSEQKMQSIRGSQMSMIFQDAMTALNPVMTVGRQLDEIFMRHSNMKRKEAKEHSIKALAMVGVPSPELRYKDFPHQLSGGMRQRVLIAMAFACQPKLIIADEPTTALDVTIQAQVLELLSDMQRKHNTSLLLITHDLSIVANMADRIYVMYSGKIVETANAYELFKKPLHPYTEGLLGAIPRLSDDHHEFIQIPDSVPHPMFKPQGCYFHPRCRYATEECKCDMPPLREIAPGHCVRCFHPLSEKGEDK
ncbi:MAG: ABC transporter ATP-binding protein [Clostridia bacterium]|nr:ABC transporter ATP-binding protein [Clostridia bacterium]